VVQAFVATLESWQPHCLKLMHQWAEMEQCEVEWKVVPYVLELDAPFCSLVSKRL
jgi:hypothetical protein